MSNINYFDLYQNLYELGYWNNKNKEVDYTKIISYNWDFIKILDIGCAEGQAVNLYTNKYNREAKGIDVAKFAIDKTKQLENVQCEVGSILDIPFSKNTFDAVSLFYTLEYIHQGDITKAVDEVSRVARRFIFLKIGETDQNKDKKWLKALREKTGTYNNIVSLQQNRLSIDTWIHLFEHYGFKLHQVKNGITVLRSRKVL